MIETHLYGYWTSPAARATALFQDTRWLGGLPFRMFLLLAGVSMAIKFEAQIARGVERSAMVRGGVKRGFEILVLAYAFRLQEYAAQLFLGLARSAARRHPELHRRVDDAGGADQRAAPRAAADRGHAGGGGRAHRLGPIIGPTRTFPAWLPRHLTSYIGGPTRWRRSRLIPPMAWTLVGIAVGPLAGCGRAATRGG